jgi:hypothetical protein
MSESVESNGVALNVAKAMAQSKSQPTDVLATSTTKLLRSPRHRSFVVPVIVFGFTALVAAIGIYRQSLEHIGPQSQTEVSVSAQPEPNVDDSNELRSSVDDTLPGKPIKPAEPPKSFVLDTVQSYLAKVKK